MKGSHSRRTAPPGGPAASILQLLAVGAMGFALLTATFGTAVGGDAVGEAGEPKATFGAAEVAETPVAEHIVNANSLARLAKFNPVVKC